MDTLGRDTGQTQWNQVRSHRVCTLSAVQFCSFKIMVCGFLLGKRWLARWLGKREVCMEET